MAPLLSTPLLRTQTDRRLVELAADGRDRAFEAIVERYRRPLQRYLRRLLSEALAEDVLQASFVRAWQALRAGTDVRDLRPWLYRIAHNQALNTLRAAGSALPAVAAELPAISLEAEVERREELRAALHGIEALPDRQRAALVAIAVADRPHADQARQVAYAHGSVFTSRGRLNLRNARHREERIPLDPDCLCPVCTRWTRAYLRHLLQVGEPGVARLLTIHNLRWTFAFVASLRRSVVEGTFAVRRTAVLSAWAPPGD